MSEYSEDITFFVSILAIVIISAALVIGIIKLTKKTNKKYVFIFAGILLLFLCFLLVKKIIHENSEMVKAIEYAVEGTPYKRGTEREINDTISYRILGEPDERYTEVIKRYEVYLSNIPDSKLNDKRIEFCFIVYRGGLKPININRKDTMFEIRNWEDEAKGLHNKFDVMIVNSISEKVILNPEIQIKYVYINDIYSDSLIALCETFPNLRYVWVNPLKNPKEYIYKYLSEKCPDCVVE